MEEVGYLTVTVDLAGKGFNPKKLTGEFDHKCYIRQGLGEIKKYGRGRGKEISEEGHCSFEFGESVDFSLRVKKAVELYLKIKDLNKKVCLNIDWFYFRLLFTGCQGNMELTPEELSDLSKVEEGIAMTYIGATDFDYSKQRRLQRLKRKLSVTLNQQDS